MHQITEETIEIFREDLLRDEKAGATITKYIHEIRALSAWMADRRLTKELLLEYRETLLRSSKPQTVNGKLSAIHAYLEVMGMEQLRVKYLKVQRSAFLDENRELSEEEYRRLLSTAKDRGNERLYLLMMTICGTGIRVSELPFITLEAVQRGRAEIRLKGKCRTILLPKALCRKLSQYAREHMIHSGHIFRTRSGRPMDRTNICHEMKKLCESAMVEPGKVFPHNLRHLFARVFYRIEKNIAHLADILGHSRIETTRIYVAVSAATHQRVLEQMNLVL